MCVFFFLQGFHKIDTDRWEFANESFMKGKKHLLRNINRHRSYQANQLPIQIGSLMEMAKSRLVGEINMLRNDKTALLQEITSLQHENQTTIQLMNSLNQRMQSAEMRQKQMVSFLANVLQSPELFDHLKQQRKHSGIASSRVRRKFLKLARSSSNDSTGSMDSGASNRHSTADASSSPPTLDSSDHVLNKEIPDSILSDSIEKSLIECLDQIQDNTLAPLFLDTDIVSLVGNNADGECRMPNMQSLAFKGNNFAGLSPDAAAAASVSDHLISFPEGDLSVTDAIIDQEEVWKAITEAGPRSFSRGGDAWYGTTQYSNMFDTAVRFDAPWDLDLQIFNQGFGDGDIVGFVDPENIKP